MLAQLNAITYSDVSDNRLLNRQLDALTHLTALSHLKLKANALHLCALS
jgi:hypothetical protein